MFSFKSRHLFREWQAGPDHICAKIVNFLIRSIGRLHAFYNFAVDGSKALCV